MKTVAKAHTRIQTAVAALSLFVVSCGSNPQSARPARTSVRPVEPASDSTALVPATARRRDPCNVRSEEAKVGAQMIERGAALVFTTTDDVHHLRQRVKEFTFLAPRPTVQPRFDNVRGGVRLVFDAEAAGDVAVVQRVVREKASEIAKACGMVLAAEGEWEAEQREQSSSKPADSRASSEASQEKPAPRDKQKESESDKSDTAKPPAKPDAKPEPAKEPKPESDPKESDKPKDDDRAPKEDDKPPVPPLPGPRPDPIVPER